MSESDGHVVIVGESSGAEAGARAAAAPALPVEPEQSSPTGMIEHPAKVLRIGTMIKQLLEEVKAAPLDDASRNRLKEIHARSIAELSEGLAPELREELARLTLPFAEGTPSDAELRIAQAQLVGWLEGLFHGIQTALAQQMAVRAQIEEMQRRALPGGSSYAPSGQGTQSGPPGGTNPTTSGPYL